MNKIKTIISCEHAVNTIPEAYAHYFTLHQAVLNTHRGVDFGASYIAEALANELNCHLYQATVSRLLIDYNRSLNHPHCWSEISSQFTEEEKKTIQDNYYLSYRNLIISNIGKLINAGYQVLHISVHSFTPIFNNLKRETDVGLLYDPKRLSEKNFSSNWAEQFKKETNQLRIRFNYPYKGTADGFTTHLRQLFSANDYIGIELETNQALTINTTSLISITELLKNSLRKVVSNKA